MSRFEYRAMPLPVENATLGEGAIWNDNDSLLHWVDIDEFEIHTFNPDEVRDSKLKLTEHVGTVVRRTASKGGGFIAALPGKFSAVSDDGRTSMLASLDEPPTNRMNDGKCDPAGRFWCGSMSFDFTQGAGTLWMLDTDKSVHRKLENVTISNGIVWTANARTMYYIDTNTGSIDAFDFDVEKGTIENRRSIYSHTGPGHLDGMTIDTEDNLYVALWDGGAIYKIDPRKSTILGVIRVPGVSRVTSCAFGGKNLQDLFITTASTGVDMHEQPNAGRLFKIELPDTRGVPAREFDG